MLSSPEYRSLKNACAVLGQGPDYRDYDYVRNLQTTALDFQLKVATVNKALDWYKAHHWHEMRTHADLLAFLKAHPNTKSGNLIAANILWSNRCWTRMGFLRAVVKYFDRRGVRDIKTLRAWARESTYDSDVTGLIRSSHHSMGPAIYNWLLLRVGIPTIKPDLHVCRFVERHIGRRPTTDETVAALVRCAKELRREPHELDAAIWHHQKSGNA